VTSPPRREARVKRESDIQEKVTLYATYIGLVPVRINVTGRKGWPDYGYGYEGRMCFIEFKRPGEKPEPLQAHVHGILRKARFAVFVVDQYEYGVHVLDLWRQEIDESIKLARLRKDHD
jgi:hypothetical protein